MHKSFQLWLIRRINWYEKKTVTYKYHIVYLNLLTTVVEQIKLVRIQPTWIILISLGDKNHSSYPQNLQMSEQINLWKLTKKMSMKPWEQISCCRLYRNDSCSFWCADSLSNYFYWEKTKVWRDCGTYQPLQELFISVKIFCWNVFSQVFFLFHVFHVSSQFSNGTTRNINLTGRR